MTRRAFSVAVYVRRGGYRGEVLLIKHRRLGTWLPIGGEMEPGETPLEAATREMREETGLTGGRLEQHSPIEGVPPGYLGYEEHQAGSKGLHMNFVFVIDVDQGAEITPNEEFGEWRWVGLEAMAAVESPRNVREFGFLALEAAEAV